MAIFKYFNLSYPEKYTRIVVFIPVLQRVSFRGVRVAIKSAGF
jgi:hypothetical protein